MAFGGRQSLLRPNSIIASLLLSRLAFATSPCTFQLMRTPSQISTDEFEREDPTRNILSQLLNRPVFQLLNPKTDSGYILQFQRRSPPAVAAGVICEEMEELGWSGEGSIQGSFSYAQYWTQKDIQACGLSSVHLRADVSLLQREHFFKACCYPSFIVSIAGPWIVILGAVFPTPPIVQRLTDYLWLGNSRSNDDHALRLAHVFQSLRLAVDDLEKYYQELGLSDSHSLQATRYFPDITEYDDNTKVVRFQYLQPLEIDESCMTFLAKLDEAHGEEQVVVNFVERCGAEAHRLLASKGKAPALKYCGPISSDGKYWYGSLQMVVMESLRGPTVAQKYEESIAETVREAVRGAVRILHDQSLVHGDIRTPNIVIVDGAGDEGERMRIIDFDWAGEQGKVRYPLHLSNYIRNTLGVKDCDIITFQHDMTMVDAL
ncbi:uncharacterized protein BT62DRAFT_937134 [Guyanagaster necrorhizus]|uniref:Fungal-type protein kinase domain-containing protein n=1 Tax=Guyanagaster necrorhizus TaxID=856835 RepID=A0A9P7VJY4_9AGAR|nr:uncharacterized protein BT62DRAFT_937134 [Guyanagaster necrorhizus MCA 3950]KAG7441371.1 hypothetical protein BT62DRAFT_937134 [Guyanagaster necrorhizus MCA 3950]